MRLFGILQFCNCLLGEHFPSRDRLLDATLAQMCDLCEVVTVLDDGSAGQAFDIYEKHKVKVLRKQQICEQKGFPFPYFHEAFNLNYLIEDAELRGATHVLRIDGDETFENMPVVRHEFTRLGIDFDSIRYRVQQWEQTRCFPVAVRYVPTKRAQFGEPIPDHMGRVVVSGNVLLHHGYKDCEPEYREAKYRMWTTLETMKKLDGQWENGLPRRYNHILDPAFKE